MTAIPGRYHPSNIERTVTFGEESGTSIARAGLEQIPPKVDELYVSVVKDGCGYRMEVEYVKP